jgi:hypothetical protein
VELEDWAGKAAVLVGRLDKGALPAERQQVLELAAEVVAQPLSYLAETELDSLERVVNQLNALGAERRRAWAYLEVLEVELVAAAVTAVDPREPHLDTSRRMRAVAQGEAVATEELWTAADKAVGFAKEVGLAQRKLEAVSACMKARGYQVTTTPEGLRAAKPEWLSQHSVDIWTPPDGQIRFEMKRDAAKVRDERARHAAVERDFKESAQEIAGSFPGLRVDTNPNHKIDFREGVSHDGSGTPRTKEEDKAKEQGLDD